MRGDPDPLPDKLRHGAVAVLEALAQVPLKQVFDVDAVLDEDVSVEASLLADPLHHFGIIVLALEDLYGVSRAVGAEEEGYEGHD